jgi:3-oxo-5-alpha-steroid 4-dehydrogenase 1
LITMAIVEGWLPPTRANWEALCFVWQLFPVVSRHMHVNELVSRHTQADDIPLVQFTAVQWLTNWYPMGKTSTTSRFNLPGKYAWAVMESAGFIILLYMMNTLPKELGIKELPWGNWTMAGCFVGRGRC